MTKKNKKGFTLTELIVVIVIIGILAAVLIPSITGYVKKAHQSAALQEATTALGVYKTFESEIDDPKVTFKSYYDEITEESLGTGRMFIESSEGKPSKFVYFCSNNVVVKISLTTNDAEYFAKDDVNTSGYEDLGVVPEEGAGE